MSRKFFLFQRFVISPGYRYLIVASNLFCILLGFTCTTVMGKKTKTGKGRLDKFYHLAKEQGFRARSAFKLTQLSKQFNLFAKANVCVDLCGAPGGWSQVAVQAMPRGSKVICVDLVPIKPLKGVVTMQSDITTQACRNLIKQELGGKTRACDIVLNDGAPNVGAAWSKDAYNQVELTLHAFQLACELLRPGGIFVTKVFRSADYNSLLWAFQQLFTKVESSKPSASRAVSAEIFVVCKGFKAPEKLDPRFFNPKFVFMNEAGDEDAEEDDDTVNVSKEGKSNDKPSSLSGLLKAVGKRNRGGYAPGDDFRTVTVDEFLASKNPAELLIKCHKIIPSGDYVIPEAILASFEDVKVQGKGELYAIMKWRTKTLNSMQKALKSDPVEEDDEFEVQMEAEDAPIEDENRVSDDRELFRLTQVRMAEEKRELKRQRVKDKKALMRKKMSLDAGVGIAETTSASFEPDLFHLPTSKERSQIVSLAMETAPAPTDDNSEADDYEADLKVAQYVVVNRGDGSRLAEYEAEFAEDYQKHKKPETETAEEAGSKGKRITRRMKHMADWAAEVDSLVEATEQKAEAHRRGLKPDDAASSDEDEPEEADEDDSEDDDVDMEKYQEEVLDSENESAPPQKSVLADRWFSNPIFAKSAPEDDDDIKELREADLPQIPLSDKQTKKLKRKEQALKDASKLMKKNKKNGVEDTTVSALEVVPVMKPVSLEEIAEVQALGALMVHKKTRLAVVEAGYNKNSRNDPSNLPDWFLDEEKRFNRKQLPLTKEMMAQYRAKLREINARPIRKEAEAQGRRKRRMEKKMSSLQQQANSLVHEDGVGEASSFGSIHKAKQIVRGMREVKKEGKRKTLFLAVQRKGGASKQVGGEGGRGAKVAMVDRRLKKDRRSEKNAARGGGRKGSSKGGRPKSKK